MAWFVSLCQQNTEEFYSYQVESKEALRIQSVTLCHL